MPVPDLLRALLTAPGPSGQETAPTAAWRKAAEAFAEVSTDAMGSSIARVPGTADGPLLAVFGHIDEIGLIVTHVDDDGFLYFRGVGGWSADVLRAQRIELLTQDGPLPAVVGRSWTRPRRPGEEPRRIELDDLHLDIGARDRDDALSRVRIGDVAVVAGEPLELANGRVASRSLDNRIGAYVALEAARLVAEGGGAPGDVVAVAAVQEEVGDFGGARTSAFALEPAVAIAVDITSSTDVPGGDHKVHGKLSIGGGPAIDRGSTINPRVADLLCETAEAEGIAYAVEVSQGSTHTDMDAVHVSRVGVPSGLISVPIRYVHTPTETVSLDDVDAAARLVAAFARRLEAGTSFAR